MVGHFILECNGHIPYNKTAEHVEKLYIACAIKADFLKHVLLMQCFVKLKAGIQVVQ